MDEETLWTRSAFSSATELEQAQRSTWQPRGLHYTLPTLKNQLTYRYAYELVRKGFACSLQFKRKNEVSSFAGSARVFGTEVKDFMKLKSAELPADFCTRVPLDAFITATYNLAQGSIALFDYVSAPLTIGGLRVDVLKSIAICVWEFLVTLKLLEARQPARLKPS